MFNSFLTSKISLALRYVWEIAISILHSPLVIDTYAIIGFSLSIICSLLRDICSYVKCTLHMNILCIHLVYKNHKIPACTK